MDKVSVIIPVYNNEKYVEKCIVSLMEQTYSNLEIIVIDDGSKDRSAEIVERLSRQDSRIRLLRQANSGVAIARNRGIDAAEGEYLTFVDGDDYVSPDYISCFINGAKKADAGMVICGVSFVDESGKILSQLIPDEYIRGEREEWTFRISGTLSHFYRRELWQKYDIRFQTGERGEDLPISLFFSAVCDKVEVVSEPGYFYVQHTASARHNFRGLKNYNLPYTGLENVIQKIQRIGPANGLDFYELFVLRIFATFYFDLGLGAPKDKMKELCDYIVRILHMYFPGYAQNKLAGLFSKVRVPFSQKAAVWLLVLLVKTKLIYPVSRLISH